MKGKQVRLGKPLPVGHDVRIGAQGSRKPNVLIRIEFANTAGHMIVAIPIMISALTVLLYSKKRRTAVVRQDFTTSLNR